MMRTFLVAIDVLGEVLSILEDESNPCTDNAPIFFLLSGLEPMLIFHVELYQA